MDAQSDRNEECKGIFNGEPISDLKYYSFYISDSEDIYKEDYLTVNVNGLKLLEVNFNMALTVRKRACEAPKLKHSVAASQAMAGFPPEDRRCLCRRSSGDETRLPRPQRPQYTILAR